jgi:hypothetical protein
MPTTITRSPSATDERSTSGQDRSVGTVLLALAGVLVMYQLVTAPFIPVLTVFAVLYAAVGVGLWRSRRRWLLVVAGLLAIAYAAGAAPVFAEHLAHPESPLGFLTDVAILVGLGTVIVGVARSLRGATPGVPRPVLVGAVAIGGVAIVVSALAVTGTSSDARQQDDLEVTVSDWHYPDITVPTTAAALWVDNQDPFHHTLVVEGTEIHEVLPASTASRIPVDLPSGTYRYICDVPGHEAMSGTLVVP